MIISVQWFRLYLIGFDSRQQQQQAQSNGTNTSQIKSFEQLIK